MPSGTFTIHCLPLRARSGAVALLLGLAGAAAPALAQLPAGVYKCRSDSASGFVFQGQPCPGDLGRVSGTQPASGATAAPAGPAATPTVDAEASTAPESSSLTDDEAPGASSPNPQGAR